MNPLYRVRYSRSTSASRSTGSSLPRGPAKPTIQKTSLTGLLVALLPPTKCPLADPKQLGRLALVQFAQFIPIQNTPELDHSHTLKGFRPAHPGSPKEPSITGQIVRYLNRTLAADTLLAYNPVVEFGWDAAKHEANLHDRGIGFLRAARIFEEFVFEWVDLRRDYGEVRVNAIGMADGEILRVTYTMREAGRLCWIITCWKAGRKDRERWHAAQHD